MAAGKEKPVLEAQRGRWFPSAVTARRPLTVFPSGGEVAGRVTFSKRRCVSFQLRGMTRFMRQFVMFQIKIIISRSLKLSL